MPKAKLTSFTVYMTRIACLWVRSDIRSCIEYRIQTNNIIVLDSYFNLTNKSNVIDGL